MQPLGLKPVACLGLNLAVSNSLPRGKNIAIDSMTSDLNSHQYLSYRLFEPYHVYSNPRIKKEISEYFCLLLSSFDIADVQKVINIGTYSMAAERIESNTAAMIRSISNSI